MEYGIIGALALAFSFLIIYWIGLKRKISNKRVIYRQSDTHAFLKEFFSRQTSQTKKKSQLEQRKETQSTKIIITEDDIAYWVSDNIFLSTDVIDGRPDFENARPVDTSSMSKKELDKMLFILDNLGRGDKNERGSSGN